MSTANNDAENYLISKYSDDITYPSWNPNGTGEFSFVDCFVTAVVYSNGKVETRSEKDHLIGLPIVNNPAMVPAKLIDLDSPYHDLSSTLYGMNFGINWKPKDNSGNHNSFIGKWKPAIVSRDYWIRQINDTSSDRYTQTIAAQGSSKLVEVEWGRIKSKALTQLKEGYDISETLSVSVTLFNYTRPHQDEHFLYGVVSGTIGVGTKKESLNFVGERVMLYNKAFPDDKLHIPKHKDNPCAGVNDWMFTAYFNVNKEPKHTVTVDFGNSIKIDFGGNICNFGHLYLAMFVNGVTSTERVEVIHKLPYMDPEWYNKSGGVNDFHLSSDQYDRSQSSLFAVVWFSAKPDIDGNIPVCKDDQTSSRKQCAYVVMRESRFNLRPMDHHVLRLEAGQSIEVRLRLREYGKKPTVSRQVKLLDKSPNNDWDQKYLEVTNPIMTDDRGIATFKFEAKTGMGRPRGKLEMDGEVFVFGYCVEVEKEGSTEGLCEEGYTNMISFLVWDKTTYSEPVFWDDHVKPIFQQYERLYPAMRNILRLGQYEDVVKPHNIQLLLKAMNPKKFDHPSYMPATRDLSPSRVEMILKWLNSDNHYRNWSHVEEVLYTPPQFCQESSYEFENKAANINIGKVSEYAAHKSTSTGSNEQDEDQEDSKVMSLRGDDLLMTKFMKLSAPREKEIIPSWMENMKRKKPCTVENLKKNLQDAVTLEFSTIPPYLTAMYSLKDGYNTEVYDVIRSVVMQEMLHMAQAANILIALGGRPIIDDKDHVPKYPGHLPAGVLPGLDVSLQKASPKHIYEVFMMIEYPHGEKESGLDEDVGKQLTIGQFYKRIKQCIKSVGNKAFCNTEECLKKQLYWPWKEEHSTGALIEVKDVKSAKKAINMIVEQGEGAGKQDPTYLHTKWLAHFYKFEELACKKHLLVKRKHRRSEYVGLADNHDIEFTAKGVWPMRDNPSSVGIPHDTQVYHKAKFFHQIYRSLLAKLQEVFDGNPESINDSVYLMESLQLHIKELMKLEVPAPPGWPKHTCGPVFDYEWKENDRYMSAKM